MRRERIIASLLAVVAVLVGVLPVGCRFHPPPPWQAYSGVELPDDQTALITIVRRAGKHGVLAFMSVDGKKIPWFDLWPPSAPLTDNRISSIRVLPGSHDLEVRVPVGWSAANKHVIFSAEAGETYTVHWRQKKKVGNLWVENKSGSVVSGEKPPKK